MSNHHFKCTVKIVMTRDMSWTSSVFTNSFFNVGPPKKGIFLTTIYGLYFSHHYIHIINYNLSLISSSGIGSTARRLSNLLNEKGWCSNDPSHHSWIVFTNFGHFQFGFWLFDGHSKTGPVKCFWITGVQVLVCYCNLQL